MVSHGAFLFNGSFQCMDYIELSFFFKVQPDVAKGVLVELSIGECFFLFVSFVVFFFFQSYFTCLCYKQSRETGFGLCLNCINAFCKI